MLGATCFLWRRISHTTPWLWNSIPVRRPDVSDVAAVAHWSKMLDISIARAGGLDLEVAIILPLHHEHLRAGLGSMLSAALHRIRKLSLNMMGWSMDEHPSVSLLLSAPRLREVEVSGLFYMCYKAIQAVLDGRLLSHQDDTAGMLVNEPSLHPSHGISQRPPSITHLIISFRSAMMDVSPFVLAPNLVHVKIDLHISEPLRACLVDSSWPCLPSLQSLSLISLAGDQKWGPHVVSVLNRAPALAALEVPIGVALQLVHHFPNTRTRFSYTAATASSNLRLLRVMDVVGGVQVQEQYKAWCVALRANGPLAPNIEYWSHNLRSTIESWGLDGDYPPPGLQVKSFPSGRSTTFPPLSALSNLYQ